MKHIKFSYPAGAPTATVELTWGIEMKAPTWKVKSGAVMKRAFDGTVYSQIKGIAKKQIPLTLNALTEAEKDALLDFIINEVEGRYRVFRYIDQDSVEHDVRFLDEKFNFGDGSIPYSLSVTLEEQ